MKPMYLVVHHQGETYDGWNQPEKKAELERVLREEDHIIVEDASKIPRGVPKDRPVRVCGMYAELCVWQVWDLLKCGGYNASIYEPASYNAPKRERKIAGSQSPWFLKLVLENGNAFIPSFVEKSMTTIKQPIENLVEKATIRFPKPVSREEVERMLSDIVFLHSPYGCEARIYEKGHKIIGNYLSRDKLKELPKPQVLSYKLNCEIAMGGKGCVNFGFIPLSIGGFEYSHMRADTIPGYSWDQQPKDQKHLIELMRRDVRTYFEMQKSS